MIFRLFRPGLGLSGAWADFRPHLRSPSAYSSPTIKNWEFLNGKPASVSGLLLRYFGCPSCVPRTETAIGTINSVVSCMLKRTASPEFKNKKFVILPERKQCALRLALSFKGRAVCFCGHFHIFLYIVHFFSCKQKDMMIEWQKNHEWMLSATFTSSKR